MPAFAGMTRLEGPQQTKKPSLRRKPESSRRLKQHRSRTEWLWLACARFGVGTSAIGPPPSGNMEQYLQSLLRVNELNAGLFAPGHGPVVTATAAKVKELLDHRAERDRQIIALIERGYDTDRQIRRAIYPEIQKGLLRASRGQIRSHIARLVGQGMVAVDEHAEDGKAWKVALTR